VIGRNSPVDLGAAGAALAAGPDGADGAGVSNPGSGSCCGSAALARVGIAVDGIATSSFRITWTIDRGGIDEAVRLLHKTFIDQPNPPIP